MKAIIKRVKPQILTDIRCHSCIFWNKIILDYIHNRTRKEINCWFLDYHSKERVRRILSENRVVILI